MGRGRGSKGVYKTCLEHHPAYIQAKKIPLFWCLRGPANLTRSPRIIIAQTSTLEIFVMDDSIFSEYQPKKQTPVMLLSNLFQKAQIPLNLRKLPSNDLLQHRES